MESKADVKGQIAHAVRNSDADAENPASSRATDSGQPDMGHSFAVNSELAGNLINGEARLFGPPNEMAAAEEEEEDDDDEADDEGEEEGESSHGCKSFSCVDYLEIMHGEMLNPEANQVSEPDAADEESDFICKNPHCNFSTTDMDAYLKHEYEHVDGKSYQCDVCSMKFNMFSSMRSHRMLHLFQRPYKCRLCSKEFARKEVLLEHLVKQHSKQRPYRCPFCPKHFKLRPQLKMHLSNEHSAAMLIKTCKLCGFKSVSLNSFRRHLAICYLKRSSNSADTSECNVSPIPLVSSEASSIDFSAVSRNFSFVPSHYPPPYALVTPGDGAHALPGPSDMTQVVSLHTTTPAVCTASGGKAELDPCTGETSNVCRVSSLASSTTATVSPNANNVSNDEGPQNLVVESVGPFVKSEPSELRGEDSQNGNALPTSTMDLSTASIVETSFNCNEATCCQTTPELPVKMRASPYHGKAHAESCATPATNSAAGLCSSRSSKSCYAASKIKCSSASAVKSTTVCRCHSTEMRSSQDQRHASSGKRERYPDSRNDAGASQEEAHPSSNKRSCRDKGTSTESLPEMPPQQDSSACQRSNCTHVDGFAHSAVQQNMDSCPDTKNQIGLKNIDADSYTCPFCEIVFPDQTLYFLHRSLHSEAHPWKCNLCGKVFKDKYDFNSHIISQGHH